MTSKHCFFRMMREDFRHKVWMLVLSVLGNMLAVPVVYLISVGNSEGAVPSVQNLTGQMNEIAGFFSYGVMIFGGIVAISGALIAGLSGFRYVFHRNMTDTYHSLPVRRSTLFWISWLNGFLIWFVPFLASMGLTLMLGLGRLGMLKDRLAGMALDEEGRRLASRWITGGGLTANAFISLLALTVAFLLVYQMVLLAVMLCGNILNTLVTAGVIGVGASAVYYLLVAFCTEYFDTFIYAVGNEGVIYASPFISSILLLYRRVGFAENGWAFAFWMACIINLAVTFVLGALAYLAYLKRPSELAEQGLRMKPVRFVIQIAVTLAATLAGWMLFYEMGRQMLIWGIFGAVLSGILTFGVLDIVFHMEFRAFFNHKALMGATVAAGIFTGFLFYYDWLGYDGYLPEREEIAEIAVYDNLRSNVSGYYDYNAKDEMHPLNRMHIRDSAAAYAFLESVVNWNPAETGLQYYTENDVRYYTEEDLHYYTEEVYARVTLTSGRTYYRRYQVSNANSGPVCELFTTPEYMDVNFKIGEELSGKGLEIYLERGDRRWYLQTDTQGRADLFETLRDACNRDLEENPEAFIRGDGRLLCSIRMYGKNDNRNWELEVFEGMEHIREALRQQGFGELAEPVEAEDVEEIQLRLGYEYRDIEEGLDLVEAARDIFGVTAEKDSFGAAPETASVSQTYAGEDLMLQDEDIMLPEQAVMLRITDKAEIRELLELVSYSRDRYYSGGAFRPTRVDRITIVLSEGKQELSVNIPKGALPEKYILRFGTLQP